ncbi:MAG: PorT family protein [Lewinellaceae bacterium]|nr:PorT family protein [Saprospiraceae bacterium]MCB9337364.1 PorT family protein [Lewinellaceae bacterium]
MQTAMKTTALAIILLFSIVGQAQQVSFGFKMGAQRANVQVPDILSGSEYLPDFKSITTTNFGIVSEIALHPNFAIQPELSYVTKGFKVHENFDLKLFDVPLPVGLTAVSQFRYLEMPILAKAKVGKFYFLAGPTFGYAMKGNLETRARLVLEYDLFDTKINLDKVGYDRWEVGGMVGGGFAFPAFNGGQIFLDARYSHGFTQPYDIPLVHEKVQHKSFGLNVGFMLPLGRKGDGYPRA